MTLDQLDWQIIDALRESGRASNAQIARRLRVTEGTIRIRIKKLTDAGILRITGQVNPEFLLGHQVVMIGINVKESKSLEKTAQAIAQLEQVNFAAITSGRYDIIAQVTVDSNKGIINFLTHSLANIAMVSRTETFVLLKTYNCWA
jgi:Lrp/AsnC family transcriptional regulator, regulator for asnA, asnC and gidA